MGKKILWALVAFFLPFVAAFVHGRPMDLVINVVLCLFFWIPAVIHAFWIMHKKGVW